MMKTAITFLICFTALYCNAQFKSMYEVQTTTEMQAYVGFATRVVVSGVSEYDTCVGCTVNGTTILAGTGGSTRKWRVVAGGGNGTVTSVGALTIGTTGTDVTSSVANGTTTPVITVNIPTASASNRGALSNTDWSTFNGKQAAGSYLTGTGITGATKTKITYNANGLVTAGADATTADIAASTNKNYVTDAQATVIGNTSGTNTGDQTNISGNAATVTTNANLTGDVTSVGNASTLSRQLTPTAVKTTTYSAAINDFIPCDNTGGSFTVTLPTAPADKSIVGAKLVILGGSNTVTLATGGSDVFNKAGGSTSLTLSLLNQAFFLQYKLSTNIWYVISTDAPVGSFVQTGAAAGGDLTGTYPNPTIAASTVTNSKIANSTIDLTTKVTGVLPLANGGADGSETKVTAGTNVTVTGTGTTGSPYVVNSSGGGSGWSLTGNSGITPVTNFVGTTDSKSLWLKTNNTIRGQFDSLGNFYHIGNVKFGQNRPNNSNQFSTQSPEDGTHDYGLEVISPDTSTSGLIANTSYSVTGGNLGIRFRSARGTETTPVGVNGGDVVGGFASHVYLGGGTAKFSGSVVGTHYQMRNTPTLNNVLTAQLFFVQNGASRRYVLFMEPSGLCNFYDSTSSTWNAVSTGVLSVTGASTFTSSVTAGNFIATGSSILPTIEGGNGTTSTLILKSTTGVGAAGSDLIIAGGNNGASEFARFLNSGNFGIGVTNPADIFDVVKSSNASNIMKFSNLTAGTASVAGIFAASDGGAAGFQAYSSTFTTSGISIANSAKFSSSAGLTGGLVFSTGTTAPIIFGTNNTEVGRFLSGGQLALGATSATDKLEVTGNIALMTAGNKIKITTGTNASAGTATLSSGTITVSTTAVTASSLIFLTDATTGALTNIGTPTVGTKTAGTSFVINSSNVLDTSTVNWIIIN